MKLVSAPLLLAMILLPFAAAAADAPSSGRPLPADIEPQAVRSLMLDVVNTGKRLIAVGERGHILASLDGLRWVQVPVPVRSALTAVNFVDERHGWAVGHDATILATTDGGRTWVVQQYRPDLEKPLLDVLFLDLKRGYAVGAFGLFLQTVDGGATWTRAPPPVTDGDELSLYSLTRLANGDLLITGELGRLLLSTDEGRSWSKLNSPLSATVFAAAAFGPGGVVICGQRGLVWVSRRPRNGGWNPIDTGTRSGLQGCSAIEGDRAALVGQDGAILIADPAALTVTRFRSPSPRAWSAVVRWQTGLVVAGESGLKMLGPVR